MGFPEEIYFAMLDLGHCARRDKVPGPLIHIDDTARDILDLCRRHYGAVHLLASMMLSSGPTDLREINGDLLPESTSMAYWRLISLLKYIRDHGTEAELTLLQPKGILERPRSYQETGNGREGL